MTTVNNTAVITRLEAAAQFKTGNTRSLAMMLTNLLGSEQAWELARLVKRTISDFNAQDVIDLLTPAVDLHEQQAITEVEETIIDAVVLPYGQLLAGETKNDRIRVRLAEGVKPTAIGKELGLTVDRVKNVRKAELRRVLAQGMNISQQALRKQCKEQYEAKSK